MKAWCWTIREKLRKKAVFLLPAVCMLLAPVLLYICGALDGLERRTQDFLYQRLSVVSPDIYVVGIDEETLMELGPFQSWSREITARLIETLTADPDSAPAVIGVDIGFYGETNDTADRRLVEACERAGNVVLASYATFGSEIVDEGAQFYARRAIKTLEFPFPKLRSSSVGNGFSNILPDEDGVVRRTMYEMDVEGERVASFDGAVYTAYTGESADPPLDRNGQWYITYSGRPGDYYGSDGAGTSFIRVLRGEIDPGMFAGSIVLVGAYSSGMMDSYSTPASLRVRMHGVEVHANILQAMLDGKYKRPAPALIQLLFIAGLSLLSLLLGWRLDLRLDSMILVLVTVAYIFAAGSAFQNGWILTVLYPLAGLWLIFLLLMFYRYLTESRERRKILRIFGRYVAPQVAENLMKQPDGDAMRLGGINRDVAVLFVDIRGFTSISETLRPEDVVEMLNRYLALTTQAIFKNGGMVDKFIGDATMGLFNAPVDLDDYVYRAVCAGLDMMEGARALERELAEKYGKTVGFGIGIHCGPAVVGNVGTEFRMDYTAIGDTVNTASRLEGQAAAGELFISRAVYERLEGRVKTEFIGERQLKGKSAGFSIYKVLGLQDLEEQGALTQEVIA